jgi:acetyltransferase
VAEYALLVRSDLQGLGIGWTLFSRILDYAAAEGIARVEGFVLDENSKMLAMCRALGFEVAHDPDEPGLCRVSRTLRAEDRAAEPGPA